MALRQKPGGGPVEDHGGSIGRARLLFPDAPEPWVDLSTGINPHSYPLFDLPATALTRLPEPGQAAELLRIAAAAYDAPSAANVVAAPGTQMLLPQVMALVAPGRAKVLGQTYAEHARAAMIAGHAVKEVHDFTQLADADLAVVVNPNNPDGRIINREALLDLALALGRRGGLLVVDEAFMDVGPLAESVARDAGMPGLVILRSFGKFFGLAGIRLGFALGEARIAARLEHLFGPWAVSGPALEYGLKALGDETWQRDTRKMLALDAARLDRLFGRYDVPVAGGTSLFRFIESRNAASLFDALGRAGILLRNFSWSATALRCGLPSDESQWQRLERALFDWRSDPQALLEKIA